MNVEIMKKVKDNYNLHETVKGVLSKEDLSIICRYRKSDEDPKISENIRMAYYMIKSIEQHPELFLYRYFVNVDHCDMSGDLQLNVSSCSANKTLAETSEHSSAEYVVNLSFRNNLSARRDNIINLIYSFFEQIEDCEIDLDEIRSLDDIPAKILSTVFCILMDTKNFEILDMDESFKPMRLIVILKEFFDNRFSQDITFPTLDKVAFTEKEIEFFKSHKIGIKIICYDEKRTSDRKDIRIYFDEREDTFKEETIYPNIQYSQKDVYDLKEEHINKFISECYDNGLFSLNIKPMFLS